MKKVSKKYITDSQIAKQMKLKVEFVRHVIDIFEIGKGVDLIKKENVSFSNEKWFIRKGLRFEICSYLSSYSNEEEDVYEDSDEHDEELFVSEGILQL